ncbi:MAG TPA: hypothetical protein VG754_08225 [Verrucomicrobiae bacterium]|nr:hypothetical protein [Verrucomicrobiae bacterium]
MSTSPEAEFDLEKLFLPAWAQESPAVNRYAKYEGDNRPVDRDRKFDDRRAGGRRPPRRDGPRPGGGPGGPNRDQNRQPRNDRPAGPGGPRREGDRGQRPGGPGGPRRDFRRDDRDRGGPREPAIPLPEISITLMPDDKGVDSLSRQIKMSGRSFPLFDIAQMILQKPERQQVRFDVKKKPDGTIAQPLFLCAVDDTLWLSEQEAIEHLLSKHFGMFYQAEKTPTEPPKGTYTFVAQCGMSGIILGPPNYHDYQNQLHKLHTERFSRMPFDMFKARVKIVREEAVVKKWIEDQSVKTEYVCLNVPEATRLGSREAVEAHFREVHLANLIKQVEKHTLSGAASRQLRSPGLQRLLRIAWDEQKRFPLQIATILSQQFASHGLQFFKVNKTITHVSVARPHYLDLEATPVSNQVKEIVQFINAHPRCTRRLLLEKLAPTPPIPVHPPTPVAAEAAAPASTDGTPAPAAPVQPAAPAEPTTTPEQAAIIGDLHWLIHQGHVIEFANGILETAKKPVVKPPKAPKPAPAEQAAAVAEQTVTAPEAVPVEAAAPPVEVAAAPDEAAEPSMATETTPPVSVESAPVSEPPHEPATT